MEIWALLSEHTEHICENESIAQLRERLDSGLERKRIHLDQCQLSASNSFLSSRHTQFSRAVSVLVEKGMAMAGTRFHIVINASSTTIEGQRWSRKVHKKQYLFKAMRKDIWMCCAASFSVSDGSQFDNAASRSLPQGCTRQCNIDIHGTSWIRNTLEYDGIEFF